LSKEIISNGENFVVEQVDRAFGGARKTVLSIDGSDGSVALGANGSISVDGEGTPSVSGALLRSTQDPVVIFVDATLGSDGNPGTMSEPLQSLHAAITSLPLGNGGRVRIKLAAGVYSLKNQDYYAPIPSGSGTPLCIEGTPIDQLGGAQVATSGTTGTTVNVEVVTTSHTMRGTTLVDLTSGEASLVLDNEYADGTTTFTLQSPLYGSDVGDTIVVNGAGSQILMDAYDVAAFPKATVGFTWCKIGSSNEPGFPLPTLVFPGGAGVFYGCEFDGGSSDRFIFITHGGTVWLSGLAESWFADGDENPFMINGNLFGTSGSGLYVHSSGPYGASVIAFDRSGVQGSAIIDNASVQAWFGSSLSLDAVNGVACNIFGDEKAAVYIGSGSMSDSLDGQDMVVVTRDSYLNAGPGGLVLENSDSAGITVDRSSYARVRDVSGTNGAYGIICTDMSRVHLSGATVTGETEDTLINSTAKAYADLPYTDAETLTRIQ